MGRAEKKYWSYIAGERGRNWVRAFEKGQGGILFVEWYEEVPGRTKARRKRASLGHRDRTKAKNTADEIAAAFARKEAPEPLKQQPGDITLHELLDVYLERETPYKGTSKQGHDQRAAAVFKSFFSSSRPARTLNLGDWNEFIRARRERRIGPPRTVRRARERRIRGEEVPPIGDRQIEYDLKFLWAVLNWATKTGDDEGNLLLAKNPLREFVRARDWPREKNPDRPSLTDGQYHRILEAAASIDWRFEVALVLAHETGHRIGSIRRLRWSDLEVREGWVRWREENDKVEWEHLTPLTPDALSALRRAGSRRTDAEDGWVFPSPTDPGRPCSRNIMRDWWNAAQEAAGLGDLPRLGWHSLRRKFANDLRHVPLKDLAALGGWKDTQTLLKCYLTKDEAAMVEALRSRARGIESKGEEGGADVSDDVSDIASDGERPEAKE